MRSASTASFSRRQLFKGLGLRLLDELGVGRKDATAERLERQLIDGLLALERFRGGVLVELRLDAFLLLAGLHALDGIEDLGEEAALFDLGPEARAGIDDLRLRRELDDGLAVHRALVVDLNEVAVLDRLAVLGILELRISRAEAGDLLVDRIVTDGDVRRGDLETLVGRDLERRLDLDDGREAAALGVELHVLDVGNRNLLKLLGLDRLADVLLEHRTLGLLLKTLGKFLADEFKRDLARTKSRKLRLTHESLLDFLHNRLHLLGVQRDVQLNLALIQLLRISLHLGYSPRF